MSEPLIPTDSVDSLIAKNLPAWLLEHENIDRLHGLRLALRKQEDASAALEAIMRGITPLDVFAGTLLNTALNRRGLGPLDIHRSRVRIERTITLPPMAPGWPIRRHLKRSSTPVLAAALHNFHIAETRPSSERQGLLVDAKGKRMLLGFTAFAGLCREVDIGGRYQALLGQHLTPADEPGTAPGSAQAAVHRCFEQSLCAHMDVAVRCALLKGELDERFYYMLAPAIAAVAQVPAVNGDVTPRQLYLLGKRIRGVVALELRASAGAQLQAVVAWIPNDPHTPISVHRTWEDLYRLLARRLASASYQRFFARFIGGADTVAFRMALLEHLQAVAAGATAELDGRNLAIEGGLWPYLRGLTIDKIFEDARCLATPTADVDQAERDARMQAYAELGLNLLGLAGLFVPVLGEAMLAVTAVDLAKEVYEGYQDWQIGDRRGALDHLFGVAENVIVGALIGKGSAAAKNYLQRVPFVDDLHPVRVDAGRTRLVAQQLPGYQASWGGAQGSHEWRWYLDDATFRVVEAPRDGGARIVHAKREEAWQPRLEDNGADGWRHELEQPGTWQGAAQLVRRLSSRLAGVSHEAAEFLLQVTGLSEDQLRRIHLEQVPAPARLYDALDLYRAHQRFPDLRGPALEQIAGTHQGQAQVGAGLLSRVFPGLSLRQLSELLDQCSSAEREQLSEHQRVPLSVAERARWQLRERRLDRACAGLRLPRAMNADSERLALGLLEEGLAWPETSRIELREDSENGPLLASAGAEQVERPVVIFRRSDGYRSSAAPGVSHSLQRALLLSLEQSQLSELEYGGVSEDGIGHWLADLAFQDRQRAVRLCGMQTTRQVLRPPLRLGDGRLGYPLSGRRTGEREAIRRGIQRIFPTLDDDELQAYLQQLAQQRIGLWEHHAQLQDHLERLRSGLRTWRRAASNPLQGVRRRRLETVLRRCWRRKTVNWSGEYVLELDGEHVGSLPALPSGVRFEHVQRMTLCNLDLGEIEEDFLQRFPNLVELNLGRNRLSQIPLGLVHMPQLRTLDLARNQIVLDASGEQCLAQLRHLRLLDLSHNPLGRAPVLTGLRQLRDIRLRSTGLEHMPERVSWRATVDLRDNRIRQLRQDVQRLRLQVEDHALHDNPLDPASEALLEQAREPADARRAGTPRRHHPVDASVFELLAAGAGTRQLNQWQATWNALQHEQGASPLLRFLADFAHSEDFAERPAHYRSRIWRILEYCEQHETVRVRVFTEAGGTRTCEDRLLLILGQLELSVLVERAVAGEPASSLERRLLRLARSLWRLDEVDQIATRHIARLRTEGTMGIDEIETRLYYRQKLTAPLDLPLGYDQMHFPGFAHVSSSDLLRAREQVLQAETPQLVAQSLAQRPFWQVHAQELYPARFEDALRPLHERMDRLDEQIARGEIDDWTYTLRCQALKYEHEASERRLLITLAQELQEREASLKPEA